MHVCSSFPPKRGSGLRTPTGLYSNSETVVRMLGTVAQQKALKSPSRGYVTTSPGWTNGKRASEIVLAATPSVSDATWAWGQPRHRLKTRCCSNILNRAGGGAGRNRTLDPSCCFLQAGVLERVVPQSSRFGALL